MSTRPKRECRIIGEGSFYREINCGQSFDTIGKEIAAQLRSNPEALELRYSKIHETQFMYRSEVLARNPIPALEGLSLFMDISDTQGLPDFLSPERIRQYSPSIIRVIRPSPKKDLWGIFFRG